MFLASSLKAQCTLNETYMLLEAACVIIGTDAHSLQPIYFRLNHLLCMKPSIITTVNIDIFVFI